MIGLFFDTETTGIKTKENPDFKPALVQLGAILQDTKTKDVLAEVNLICTQTNGPIPEAASNIHGISDEMAAKYGVDIRMIDMVFACLISKADVIVAHNIDYDMDVVHDNMEHSWKRIKDKQQFCTMENNINVVKAPFSDKQKWYYTSKGIKPDAAYKRPSLMETHVFYFGTEFEGAHDAMADIRACRDVFMAMDTSSLTEETATLEQAVLTV